MPNSLLANKLINTLSRLYPSAKSALDFKDPLQLLVSTILSAQSTDKQINKLAPALFKKFKNAKDFAMADPKGLERYIHSSGFFRNKARNIKAAAQMIMSDFHGMVPENMEDLVKLPGVARKTANVVLFNAFGKNEGVAVDTHVQRLAQRLGLSKNKDPKKIEQDLMKLFPRKRWGMLTHYLIAHGRETCDAKRPKCGVCRLNRLCQSFGKFAI